MLRLMLLSALLLGLVPAAHARQPFGPRRLDPAQAPPVMRDAGSEPVKQWLDCLDPSGRPAKVYGWLENGTIRFWDAENPHLAARPQPLPSPIAPPVNPPVSRPGPTVNYGVNLPSPAVAESTRTNDRGFAESMISEQEATAEASAPSPGGLFDRLRPKPKPKPCPGPGPCPAPDETELPPEPEGESRHLIVIGIAAAAAALALLALLVVAVFAVLHQPKSPREAPVHVAP